MELVEKIIKIELDNCTKNSGEIKCRNKLCRVCDAEALIEAGVIKKND